MITSPGSRIDRTVTEPFHNPFAVLRPAGSRTPGDVASEPAATPAATPAETDGSRTVARAVVRIERRGRGGKAVTVVDHLDLSAAEYKSWLKALQAALGCGGAVEGDAVVLQGDQRTRVVDLLRARGVRKVTVGS
jgi:translation initiation factor 1